MKRTTTTKDSGKTQFDSTLFSTFRWAFKADLISVTKVRSQGTKEPWDVLGA